MTTDASEFGYRVNEVLAGVNTTAVGRSNQIEGTLTIQVQLDTVLSERIGADALEALRVALAIDWGPPPLED